MARVPHNITPGLGRLGAPCRAAGKLEEGDPVVGLPAPIKNLLDSRGLVAVWGDPDGQCLFRALGLMLWG